MGAAALTAPLKTTWPGRLSGEALTTWAVLHYPPPRAVRCRAVCHLRGMEL